jgi:spore coat polysaccharide biosynthesis predicted glycosyltransferase SpsG
VELRFFVEASPTVGHGHVVRCAALAEEAQHSGLRSGFVPANSYTERLLDALNLPQAANAAALVVIDHHSPVDPVWVEDMRASGSSVAMIDHQGPARTVADLVCDALIGPEMRNQLPHSNGTRYLYGLDYILLRRQFRDAHAFAHPGRTDTPRLMVAMGGVDQYQVTPRLAVALDACGFTGPATFVVEEHVVDALRDIVRQWTDTRVLAGVSDMASIMLESDLLVSKVGGMTLEAFCVGIGAAMVEPTPAHVTLSASLAAANADWPALPLGLAEGLDMNAAAQNVCAILADQTMLRRLGRRGAALVDGRGCERVVGELVALRDVQ